MSIDLSTQRTMFDGIRAHVGHDIEVVAYGDPLEPVNVAIECVTCGTVLLDADAPAAPYYSYDHSRGVILDSEGDPFLTLIDDDRDNGEWTARAMNAYRGV